MSGSSLYPGLKPLPVTKPKPLVEKAKHGMVRADAYERRVLQSAWKKETKSK